MADRVCSYLKSEFVVVSMQAHTFHIEHFPSEINYVDVTKHLLSLNIHDPCVTDDEVNQFNGVCHRWPHFTIIFSTEFF
jgi:hypothetical protein